MNNSFFGNMFVLQLGYDYYEPKNLGLTLESLGGIYSISEENLNLRLWVL